MAENYPDVHIAHPITGGTAIVFADQVEIWQQAGWTVVDNGDVEVGQPADDPEEHLGQ